MPEKIILRRFNDMHCHFRLLPLLAKVLPFTAEYADWGVAMPNTRPRAILNAVDVMWYREMIKSTIDAMPKKSSFIPLMTIEIRDNTTPKIIRTARRAGAVAGKVYPLGTTTNSDEGLHDFFSSDILETFQAMQDAGMLLLIHGELDIERILVTGRERAFLPTLARLAETFPKLNIVLEHISTRLGVEMVERLGPNVAGTITAHHLCLTLNDVVGYGVKPHNACMPIAKDFDDQDALIKAATSGNPKFFLGSDTAPHLREQKECANGKCGVFTAPVLPALLAEIFDKAGCLDKLEDFTSRFSAEFYGLPPNRGHVTIVKKEWRVPNQCNGVVPFRAGTMMKWRFVENES